MSDLPDLPPSFGQPDPSRSASRTFVVCATKGTVSVVLTLIATLGSLMLIPLAGVASALAIPLVVIAVLLIWLATAGVLVFAVWPKEVQRWFGQSNSQRW